MCKYCKDSSKLISKEVISASAWCFGWEQNKKVTLSEAEEDMDELAVLLDSRGYLRLVDPTDCQCMDHGENIKINFCPFCGMRL